MAVPGSSKVRRKVRIGIGIGMYVCMFVGELGFNATRFYVNLVYYVLKQRERKKKIPY